jgi:hypothetical protein
LLLLLFVGYSLALSVFLLLVTGLFLLLFCALLRSQGPGFFLGGIKGFWTASLVYFNPREPAQLTPNTSN